MCKISKCNVFWDGFKSLRVKDLAVDDQHRATRLRSMVCLANRYAGNDLSYVEISEELPSNIRGVVLSFDSRIMTMAGGLNLMHQMISVP
jgi:hypothetical protein